MDIKKRLELNKIFPASKIEEWEKIAFKELNGKRFDTLFTTLPEQVKLKSLYTQKDLPPNILNEFPGLPNFARGNRASGFLINNWLTAQKVYESSPQKANSILKNLEQNGLNTIAFEIGTKHSVNVSNVKDLEILFKGIDLKKYNLLVDAKPYSLPFLVLLFAYLKKTEQDFRELKGGILSDPIGYSAYKGELSGGLLPLVTEAKEILNSGSKLKSIDVSTVVYSLAGANAVQELAIALATGVEYINFLLEEGFEFDFVNNLIQFTFAIDSSFFKNIAKLRAFRLLWQNVTEHYGKTSAPFIRAITSKFNFTKYDPYVNMLRGTTEAFSAIAGGANAIEILPFDLLHNKPSNLGIRIAKNVHLILKEETHLDKIIDPAGGSFFVENLTSELAEKSWELFQTIQSKGGIIASLKNRFVQQEIENNSQKLRKDFETGNRTLVGINKYANPEEKLYDYNITDAEGNKKSSTHTSKSQNRTLKKLNKYLHDANKFFEYSFELVNKGVSIEELSFALYSKDKITVPKLKIVRLAEEWENVRLEFENILKNKKRDISASVLLLGRFSELKKETDFLRGFFEAGGITVKTHDKIEEVLKAKPEMLAVVGKDKTKVKNIFQQIRKEISPITFSFSELGEKFSFADFTVTTSSNKLNIYKSLIEKIKNN